MVLDVAMPKGRSDSTLRPASCITRRVHLPENFEDSFTAGGDMLQSITAARDSKRSTERKLNKYVPGGSGTLDRVEVDARPYCKGATLEQ